MYETVRKQIAGLGRCFEAVWVSARFCLLLRQMKKPRTYRTNNRMGICERILCSLFFMYGIIIYTKGNTELIKGNIRGIKMITEGAGATVMAATLKQDGAVLMGGKNEKEKTNETGG